MILGLGKSGNLRNWIKLQGKKIKASIMHNLIE